MIELNGGMLIGFGLALFTLVTLGLMVRQIIKKVGQERDWRQQALDTWRLIFWTLCLVSITLFTIAFIWTGIRPAANPNQPEGSIDSEPASSLEYKPGDNRSAERIERLKVGDTIQKEGQKELEDFRNKFFSKDSNSGEKTQ